MSGLMLLGLAGLVGAGAALWLTEACIRRTTVGVGLVFIHLVTNHADVPLPVIMQGGIAIYAGDLVLAIIATACAARLLRKDDWRPVHFWLLVVVGIAVYSLLRGMAAFGPSAVSESRRWLLPIAVMVYVAAAHPTREVFDRIGRYWVWAGVVLSLVALGRWGALVTGINLSSIFTPNNPGDIRVLGAAETLLIAQAFLIVAPSWDRGGSRRDRVYAAGLLAAVLLLQHRTVWVATLASILVMFWRRPALGRRFGLGLVAIGMVSMWFATTILATDQEKLESRATNVDTFGWRVAGWQDLIERNPPEDIREWVVGRPFGTGWERRVNNILRDESPHSLYVEGITRIGILGMLILIAISVLVAWRLASRPRRPSSDLLNSDVLLYLLVFHLLYGITYHPEVTNFLTMGLAAGVGFAGLGREQPANPSAIAGHQRLAATGMSSPL